jgi:SAM-dependent methyltransferase
MHARILLVLVVTFPVLAAGCRTKYREDLDYSYNVQQTWPLEDLHFGEIVQFETVFWEPDDTVSLRDQIVDDRVAAGRRVLEIGTGTGVLSILCLQNDATSVVATDINPAAVANAQYNAAMLVPDQELDVRRVAVDSPGAFSVIKNDERFDLIISNPPWEDGTVAKPADHAYYDPHFALMDSLLDGLTKHLYPGGRCLLAYGHVPAIRRLQVESEKRNYEFKILDDRDLDSLPINFLPGMLIEIRPPVDVGKVSGGKFSGSDDGPQQVGSAKDESPSADPDQVENATPARREDPQ